MFPVVTVQGLLRQQRSRVGHRVVAVFAALAPLWCLADGPGRRRLVRRRCSRCTTRHRSTDVVDDDRAANTNSVRRPVSTAALVSCSAGWSAARTAVCLPGLETTPVARYRRPTKDVTAASTADLVNDAAVYRIAAARWPDLTRRSC